MVIFKRRQRPKVYKNPANDHDFDQERCAVCGMPLTV
jgi:hypothetical protein